jgi:hypothetical protein
VSLTVEDGTGLPGADAYASRASVLAYWTARADPAFGAATAEVQDAAIRRATQFLDIEWGPRFRGERESATQALEWPRTEAGHDGVVPPRLIHATAELAKLALAGPLGGAGVVEASPSQSEIASVTAGSVAISYRTDRRSGALEEVHADRFFLVRRILAPLVKGDTVNRGFSR